MKELKRYRVWGYDITIKDAAKYAGVSVDAVRAMLSKLGGSMETVMRVYDERYGGVRTRLEAEKGADATELAAEEILNVVFNGKEGAHREGATRGEGTAYRSPVAATRPEGVGQPTNAANVPVKNVADELEAAPTEGLSEEPTGGPAEEAHEAPLAVEFAEVLPKRKDLKLLNDAIEALERLSDSGWEMSAKVRRDAVAMVEGWKNERLLSFKELIDWRALEEYDDVD